MNNVGANGIIIHPLEHGRAEIIQFWSLYAIIIIYYLLLLLLLSSFSLCFNTILY